ncbi:uncharacterized protein LOC141651817 [Silene latifolia]|uniref:uncharacterized protein LOC141651817 n=1 Tax=Silene latifolia TaxID=37657 RepID=UPI003D77F7F3
MCLSSDVSYHPRCSKLKLTHLVFADDLMIFTRGDLPSVQKATAILSTFSHWSGLTANLEKTDIYFGGVHPTVKALILERVGIKEGSFPFRYLGYPINDSRLTMDMYNALILKLQTLKGTYSIQHLSYAGRIQVLNSIVFGLNNFSVHRLIIATKQICLLISKISRDIFSGRSDKKKKHIFKAWDCFSKVSRGVLLLRDARIKQLGTLFERFSYALQPHYRDRFFVKKAYDSPRCSYTVLAVYKAIHRTTILPRHKIILMLAIQQKLATQDLLITRGIVLVNRCYLCKAAAESADHLFFACPYAAGLLTLFAVDKNYLPPLLHSTPCLLCIAGVRGVRNHCLAAALVVWFMLFGQRGMLVHLGIRRGLSRLFSVN